jgi:hypothetical protein
MYNNQANNCEVVCFYLGSTPWRCIYDWDTVLAIKQQMSDHLHNLTSLLPVTTEDKARWTQARCWSRGKGIKFSPLPGILSRSLNPDTVMIEIFWLMYDRKGNIYVGSMISTIWRWGRYIPPKRRDLNEVRGIKNPKVRVLANLLFKCLQPSTDFYRHCYHMEANTNQRNNLGCRGAQGSPLDGGHGISCGLLPPPLDAKSCDSSPTPCDPFQVAQSESH